jgi:hypothetical protein
MRRISEKMLFGLMLSIFLSVQFSGIGLPVKAASGSIKIDVPVRGAYLYVDPQDNSGVESPGIADLQSNGISDGDTIQISFEGTVDQYGATDYHTLEYLIGVFSSTNQLLSVSEADRVPGAIDAGEDFDTGQTWFSHENTDIPEDFQITPSTGFSIQVPQNAKYLFMSMLDSWYPDNTSPSPFAVTIEKQVSGSASGGFPLEYLLAVLGIVAVVVVLVVFFIFKRRKSGTQK